MKRVDLIRKISRAAKTSHSEWLLEREGKHSVYTLDGARIPIPRHNEINELTAQGIMKSCETALGEGWWR